MSDEIDWHEMKPGMKVRFEGYTSDSHRRWGYTPGAVYEVIEDEDGDVGPIDKDGVVPPENFGFKFSDATRPDEPERKTVEDAVEYYNGEWPFGSADGMYTTGPDWDGADRFKGTYMSSCESLDIGDCSWVFLCTRDEFEAEVERQKGEQWTHTWRDIECRIVSEEEDQLGRIPVMLKYGDYNVVKAAHVKPIKPAISKAEAWDKISQTYLMCGWSLKDAVKDIEKVYEVR